MNLFDQISLFGVLPEIIVTLGAFIILIFDLFGVTSSKRSLAWFALITLGICGYQLVLMHGTYIESYWGMLTINSWSILFKWIFLFITGITILISMKYIEQQDMNYGEYYVLLLLSTVGMMFMVSSHHLLVIFIGLEIVSICSYILCGMQRKSNLSGESALKYFLSGAFATGFLLYGIVLIYGSTGSFHLSEIGVIIANNNIQEKMILFGLLLLFCGFAFKMSVAPFHMWVPDVYQGAPTPITAFMSVGPKTANFAACIQILVIGFLSFQLQWSTLIVVLSVVTMTVGNVLAIVQTNVKRMLAYSSIAHVGYMLVGFLVLEKTGISAIYFYLLAYSFTSLGAFGVLIIFGGKYEKVVFEDYKGLGFQYPFFSIALSIFLFSMIGIPLTGGFIGKFTLFSSVLDNYDPYFWLIIIALLNSVISAFYYLKLVLCLYTQVPHKNLPKVPEGSCLSVNLGVLIAVAGVLCLGVFPQYFLEISNLVQNSF